jgi:hypothetical protein
MDLLYSNYRGKDFASEVWANGGYIQVAAQNIPLWSGLPGSSSLDTIASEWMDYPKARAFNFNQKKSIALVPSGMILGSKLPHSYI